MYICKSILISGIFKQNIYPTFSLLYTLTFLHHTHHTIYKKYYVKNKSGNVMEMFQCKLFVGYY